MAAWLPKVRANGKRVLDDLHHLRSIGAGGNFVPTARGGDGVCKGVVRPALSPEDIEARSWLMERAEEVGLDATMDRFGSTIARGDSSGPRLLAGSHSDTQPEGGWLDGALGVVFALEAARALAEAGGPAAIDVVNWQDEEGRFGSLVGSTAYTKGAATIDMDAVSLVPAEVAPKLTLTEAIEARGLSDLPIFEWTDDEPYFGYFEAHIEQGRRLEDAGHSVAPVTSIVGLRLFKITFVGEQNHAGTTTMAHRKDAARVAFAFAHQVHSRFNALTQGKSEADGGVAVWTIGSCDITPGAVSIVPGKAELVLQFRDPTVQVLDRMEATVDEIIESIRQEEGSEGVQVSTELGCMPVAPIAMDDGMQQIISTAADELAPGGWQPLHSAAVHDAGLLASVMPSSMLFVPSINGISHDFAEDTKEEDIIRGAEVYAAAAARMVAAHVE